MTWGGLYARDPVSGPFCRSSVETNRGNALVPQDQEKTHVLVMGITESWRPQRQNICWRAARKYARSSAIARRRQAGRARAWNWLTAIGMIQQPSSGRLKGVERRVCHVAGCLGAVARLQRSQGVIGELCRGAHQGSAAAGGSAFVDGCEQNQRARDDTALSLLEQGFRDLISPIAFVRAGGFFENFLYGLQVARAERSRSYYNPTNPEIGHGRDERHRRGGRNPFDRASLVRAARRRAWFDGHRG